MPRALMMSPLESPSALSLIACSTISYVSFVLRPVMRDPLPGLVIFEGYSLRGCHNEKLAARAALAARQDLPKELS